MTTVRGFDICDDYLSVIDHHCVTFNAAIWIGSPESVSTELTVQANDIHPGKHAAFNYVVEQHILQRRLHLPKGYPARPPAERRRRHRWERRP